jgi:hypothetical protein
VRVAARSLHILFALALCGNLPLYAQRKTVVPFVGCKAQGQLGPIKPPTGEAPEISIPARASHQLAYYKSDVLKFGVLAPAGWHCFAISGSGGATLFVYPELSDDWQDFNGDAIELSVSSGASGSDTVARVIARVFPAHNQFVKNVIVGFDLPPDTYPSGPFPTDRLRYKNQEQVEYTTPPDSAGLGTLSELKRNGSPISGVAMLIDEAEDPGLLQLSIRMPSKLAALAPLIAKHVEAEAAKYIAPGPR